MTNTYQHAFYVCLNRGEAYAPEEIRRKSVCMNEDIGAIALLAAKYNLIFIRSIDYNVGTSEE